MSSLLSRQIRMGNIPDEITEGTLIRWFHSLEMPVPWKALVRRSRSGRKQWAIATMESIADCQTLLSQRISWPNGAKITLRRRINLLSPRCPYTHSSRCPRVHDYNHSSLYHPAVHACMHTASVVFITHMSIQPFETTMWGGCVSVCVCAGGEGFKQHRRRTLLGIHDLFPDHITNCVVRFPMLLNEITSCKLVSASNRASFLSQLSRQQSMTRNRTT